ncbi:hypothetical protein N7L96_08790 [Mammaliicoccus sciuri]|uniref:hypothetical protein n=2 Tax=Mammaliicoccus sciuri TaxID=1296 RepID=UPI001954EAA6|nr:hypothetical protein [Mammaliicoccus sciuri]MCJ1763243.1 hypothetical protein [Mammaliicoccus sciuri]MCJ1772026.1 hypothetical protein [Mammaliicoccus sciuri]MDC5694698.1 hypothetical protein [Mammaliicoccus sciuri]
MKKILLAALTGTLLLGACTNTSSNDEKKEQSNSNEKNNKKVMYVYNAELRNYLTMNLATYEKIFNYIDSTEDDDNFQEMIDAYRQYSKDLDDNLKYHKKHTKDLKGKKNEKKINDGFIIMSESLSKSLKDIARKTEKFQSGEITEDELYEHFIEIQKELENKKDEFNQITEDISDQEFKDIMGSVIYKKYKRVMNQFPEDGIVDEEKQLDKKQ